MCAVGTPFRWTFAIAFKKRRYLLHFALPALLTAFVVAPTNWFAGTIVARQPHGLTQLGLFGAADRWRTLLMFLPVAILGGTLPILSNLHATGEHKAKRTLCRANLLITVAVTAAPACILALFPHPCMSVFGKQYQAGAVMLLVLAITAVPQALNTFFGQQVILRSMWIRLGFDCVLASMTLIGARVLVPRYGGLGLALANLAAYTAVVLMLLARTSPEDITTAAQKLSLTSWKRPSRVSQASTAPSPPPHTRRSPTSRLVSVGSIGLLFASSPETLVTAKGLIVLALMGFVVYMRYRRYGLIDPVLIFAVGVASYNGALLVTIGAHGGDTPRSLSYPMWFSADTVSRAATLSLIAAVAVFVGSTVD